MKHIKLLIKYFKEYGWMQILVLVLALILFNLPDILNRIL